MDVLDLARWQFAITTVYHFFFVPVTIGLSAIVAWYHSRWIRTRNEDHLRMAKFLGKLFTINFALGLVTGIVQEFQFGMNWSTYSRFVGDIFGAPLALEALLAFFLESTFLGLWIFGWGRIPERLHAATMWIVHIGTLLSAYFILAANSFMQHPVGYRINPVTGRAEMADFWAVLTNPVQLVAFPHVITACYLVGGALVMAVGLHKLRQGTAKGGPSADRRMYRHAARLGAVVVLVAGMGVAISGDLQGKVMTEVQPMKMAAAEALYDTPPAGECAPFSVLTIAGLGGENPKHVIEIPCLLSFLGTGSFDGQVRGIADLEAEYRESFGDGELTQADTYVPPIAMTYWNFRLMMATGFFAMAVGAWVLWATRKDRIPMQRWVFGLIVLTPIATVLGHSFGWIFTEVGRQPWVVFGEMATHTAVSPSVGTADVWTSMLVFTALYGGLAVVEVRLLLDYIRRGAEPFEAPRLVEDDQPLEFSY
ncbi:cytochrome BD ubiquinol oxidase subunit I [Janibacter sp. Soil728]|uniref:cytochrome ubiquinol oxidase subunit I n=1 Tax=Janibacter sp. Soil728 TaxID=1736393 RepID=UPI0006F6128D|nr:cytochrome ubiquinol oxidase subunit I [Janibacter sp. Soil728]KRE39455.1 cytochrome BD ubiquinol oxidase subunit I [Janibacter sp. Soil728]